MSPRPPPGHPVPPRGRIDPQGAPLSCLSFPTGGAGGGRPGLWGGGQRGDMRVCSRLSRRGRRFLPLTQTHQQGNKGEERAAAAAPHNAGALLSMTCDGGRLPPLPCPAHGPHPAGPGAERDPQTRAGHPPAVLVQGVPTIKCLFCVCRISPCHLGACPGAARLGAVGFGISHVHGGCGFWHCRSPKISRVRGVRCVPRGEVPRDVTATLSSAPAPTRGSRFSSWSLPGDIL